MAKEFKFYNLEENYIELKKQIADLLGFGVDPDGFLYDQDTLNVIKFKKKFINIYIESDNYINIVPFSLMNSHMFSSLFKLFITQLEEDGIYVRDFFEEYKKTDSNGLQKSRLILDCGNGYRFFTDWYDIPGLKFVSMMLLLSSNTTMIQPDKYIKKFDNYDLPLNYNKRNEELIEWLSRKRKKREKQFYEFK